MTFYQFPTNDFRYHYNIVFEENDFKELHSKINWSNVQVTDNKGRFSANIDGYLVLTTDAKYDWNKTSNQKKNKIYLSLINKEYIMQIAQKPQNVKFYPNISKAINENGNIRANIFTKIQINNSLKRSFENQKKSQDPKVKNYGLAYFIKESYYAGNKFLYPKSQQSYIDEMTKFFKSVYEAANKMFNVIKEKHNETEKAKSKQFTINFVNTYDNDDAKQICVQTSTNAEGDKSFDHIRFRIDEVNMLGSDPNLTQEDYISLQKSNLLENVWKFVKDTYSKKFQGKSLKDILIYDAPFEEFNIYVKKNRIYSLRVNPSDVEKYLVSEVPCRKYGLTGTGLADFFINKTNGATMEFISVPLLTIYGENGFLIPQVHFTGVELTECKRSDFNPIDDFEYENAVNELKDNVGDENYIPDEDL